MDTTGKLMGDRRKRRLQRDHAIDIQQTEGDVPRAAALGQHRRVRKISVVAIDFERAAIGAREFQSKCA